MKNFKKILIILSLSFYLSAMLIPQKDKEAHAFVLTGTIALGALAVAGMGGVIAYANRDHIAKMGETIAQNLEGTGVSVNDMLATNEYGMNKAVTEKMAETIYQEKVALNTKSFNIPLSIPVGGMVTHEIDANFQTSYIPDVETIMIKSNTAIDAYGLTFNSPRDNFERSFGSYFGYKAFVANNSLSNSYVEGGSINFYNKSNEVLNIDLKMVRFSTLEERNDFIEIDNLNTYDTIPEYQGAYDTVYNGNTVSLDYARLERIFASDTGDTITATNLDTLFTSVTENIVDAGADQLSALNTIWNGIKNIPTLIQSSSTAVLGGISTLSDDILTGLGTFTDNITRANDQLWTDAGVVWSGMTTAIDNMGLTITNSLTGTLTGLGTTVTDLGAMIGTIPGTITTGLTDTYTSVFTVPTNYFTTRTTAIQQIIIPKLPVLPDKEVIFPSQYQEMEDWAGISADFSHYGIGEQMVIDNTAPNYYRRQIKLWISAILYFFTALFVIRKVAGVINK